jgi:hypothetical protein
LLKRLNQCALNIYTGWLIKSAIQALDRLDPVLPMSPGRAERHGFEYYRVLASLVPQVKEPPVEKACAPTAFEPLKTLRMPASAAASAAAWAI